MCELGLDPGGAVSFMFAVVAQARDRGYRAFEGRKMLLREGVATQMQDMALKCILEGIGESKIDAMDYN